MTRLEIIRWRCAEAESEYIDAGVRSPSARRLRELRLALRESERVLEAAIAAEWSEVQR
jgi:hypothetical protein